MNYLAHHTIALRIAPGVLVANRPAFFIGNVLPDLLAASGVGRLRERHLADNLTDNLTRGVHLHFAADHAFHSNPAFTDAMTLAKETLLNTPFAQPPQRTFFLAHAMVEIALDGLLLQASPNLADDLYAQFAAANLPLIAETAAAWLTPAIAPEAVEAAMQRFVEIGFLRYYNSSVGLADALTGLSHRAGLTNFEIPADRERLAAAFEAFLPRLAPFTRRFLIVPPLPSVIQ